MTFPTGGIREAVARAVRWTKPVPQAPPRSPDLDKSLWIAESLALTWIGWKVNTDRDDVRTATAKQHLNDMINAGKVKSLVMPDGRLFLDRMDMTRFAEAGAVTLELSQDPAGAVINRDNVGKAPKSIVVEQMKGKTEQATTPIRLPSPFKPSGYGVS